MGMKRCEVKWWESVSSAAHGGGEGRVASNARCYRRARQSDH